MRKLNNEEKIILVKKLGKVLERRLNKDIKLSPYIYMNKGFLKELTKQIRRLRYNESKVERRP